MKLHTKSLPAWFASALVAVVAGCATPASTDYDKVALGLLKSSFRDQGQAKVERLQQDELQHLCSTPAPSAADLKRIEAQQLATIKPPSDGRYLGSWKEGEKLAQNGKGMTWSDKPNAPNGGNCYNCHQMSKAEISFGTLGPSLYHYGRSRGVANPADPSAAPTVQYTWGKIYNAKAYSACSEMPRFGHEHVLTEKQMQDLMALLLDPQSPVNQ